MGSDGIQWYHIFILTAIAMIVYEFFIKPHTNPDSFTWKDARDIQKQLEDNRKSHTMLWRWRARNEFNKANKLGLWSGSGEGGARYEAEMKQWYDEHPKEPRIMDLDWVPPEGMDPTKRKPQ